MNEIASPPNEDPTYGGRLSQLTVDALRWSRDRTWKTWILTRADGLLSWARWPFRTSVYERFNPDGTLYQRSVVRRTLAGYLEPWGTWQQYHDNGVLGEEGEVIRGRNRKYRFWLPDGTRVSQQDYLEFLFGPEAKDLVDPFWER